MVGPLQAGLEAPEWSAPRPRVGHGQGADGRRQPLGAGGGYQHLIKVRPQAIYQDLDHGRPQPGQRLLGSPQTATSPARQQEERGRHAAMIANALRAIDFHVHLPTPEWLDTSLSGWVEAAERYFRSKVARNTVEGLAAEYRALDMKAVLLAWDAETATGRPRLSNEFVAQCVSDFPEQFIGFCSVDPNKGERAVEELEAAKEMGLVGAKFHPSIQGFAPDDEKFWPVFAKCAELGLPCVFHTGTSGIGAGTPGGQGFRLDHCRPIRLDTLAAAFPALTIIAAHFGWPWHLEMLAIAAHKSNVWIDISGWAPKRIPAEVISELSRGLQDRFLFGSDYPFISPTRCLEELAALDIPEEVMTKLLKGNAIRLLGLE